MHQPMFQKKVWVSLQGKRKASQSFMFYDDVVRTNEQVIAIVKKHCKDAGSPAERVLILEK